MRKLILICLLLCSCADRPIYSDDDDNDTVIEGDFVFIKIEGAL